MFVKKSTYRKLSEQSFLDRNARLSAEQKVMRLSETINRLNLINEQERRQRYEIEEKCNLRVGELRKDLEVQRTIEREKRSSLRLVDDVQALTLRRIKDLVFKAAATKEPAKVREIIKKTCAHLEGLHFYGVSGEGRKV